MKTPACSLCDGQLVREKKVEVGSDYIRLSLAWVCTNCSAAFPIACRQGMLQTYEPLYQDGKRND